MEKVIILAVTLLIIGFVVLGKLFFTYYKRYKDAQKDLSAQKRNSAYLATHITEMARIERSNRKLKGELKNAKTDEEIADIIDTVISLNNRRVQDDSRIDSAAKTSERRTAKD